MTGAVLTGATAAISALATAIAAASPLKDASIVALAPVVLAAEAADGAIDAAISATDALIATTSVAGMVGGTFPLNLISTLQGQLAAMQNESVLMVQKGAIGRLAFNVSNAPG